ncbi:MAG: hypothetical protein QGH90_03785 [Candidatus Poseidoniaceae archaeon]|jgi:hypothetical protein|nr:hypothetical protein [Candidatus Poseidoniaceae archaeon]MDP7001004.1 hypothetical protein [Candidatus Poseidoniaceae archaeon]
MAKDVLLVYKKTHEVVHDESLFSVSAVLDEMVIDGQIRLDTKVREKVSRADFIGRDLVIILGGDGTLTSISHNIDSSTPVMGVNSHPRDDDPDGSLGFFMDSTVATFADDIVATLAGQAIVNSLPRLQATITSTSGNKIISDPALNDLLVANTHQYAPSKYRLQRGEMDIEQHSSGLLFSTFAGQGAWFSHITDSNKVAILDDEIDSHYLVVARDLNRNERSEHPEAYLAWTNEVTVITSDMHRGYVVPDGWDEYHFNRGASISVSLDAPKLNLLTFKGRIIDKMKK